MQSKTNDEKDMFAGVASLEKLQKFFEPKPMSSTRVVSMYSTVAQGKGTLLKGGDILSRIDLIASYAIRKLGGYLVCPTRSLDAVHFVAPVKESSLVIYKAQITRTWNTSLEAAVRVEVQNCEEPTSKFCCFALLTFVIIKGPLDERGKLRLPQIYPEGANQTRLFEEANRRRMVRLEEPKTQTKELALFRDYLLLDPRARENPTYCETTELVLPIHTNNIQSTFGGQLMKWMESCAAISASRHAQLSEVISASSDALQFVKPSHVNDVLTFRSLVTRSFNTSIEVYIVVTRQAPNSDHEEFTNDGFFTFVCPKSSYTSSSRGRVKFQELSFATELEKKMYASAFWRRERRLAELKTLVPPKL